MSDFVRTLRPFNNLSDPHDTIYDRLTYIKDINLIDESDVKMVSGNVVKYIKNDAPFIIDTNEHLEALLNEARTLAKSTKIDEELIDDVEKEEVLKASESAETADIDLESVKALSEADENEDDYSFLDS